MPARCQLAYSFQNAGVSRAERVAWERYFPELCGGARRVSGAGVEPGPGRSSGGVCVDEDAFNWDRLWRCGFASSVAADEIGGQFVGSCWTLRGADDFADHSFADCRNSKDGDVADPDGIDSGYCGGQRVAGGIRETAPGVCDTGELFAAGRNRVYLSDG